jgi:hypothetical protein
MTIKGYCTTADVAAITGDLTGAQMARATQLIEAAETWLDGEIGRGWLVGAQSEEAHFYPAEYLRLDSWPVTSITTVKARTGMGETETTLTVNVDYEVIDLAAGIIRIEAPGSYERIRVTYVPNDAVPADIRQAAAELTATWLLPTLNSGSFGLDSYSLPDLTVKFSRTHYQAAAPPLVAQIVARYREPVHS